jgi:fluoride exporter
MCGTLARFWLSTYVQRMGHTSGFPWGTVAVNLVGCLVAGLIWAILEPNYVQGQVRLVLLVGFMGAFTTFSSLILDTTELMREARWGWALANFMIQNMGGFALFFVGFRMGKLI